jgi:hypothetical protein
MTDFETVKPLSFWMIEQIGKNKTLVLDPENGADWNWIAAEIWRAYPGIFNEFTINAAIDFLLDCAETE